MQRRAYLMLLRCLQAMALCSWVIWPERLDGITALASVPAMMAQAFLPRAPGPP